MHEAHQSTRVAHWLTMRQQSPQGTGGHSEPPNGVRGLLQPFPFEFNFDVSFQISSVSPTYLSHFYLKHLNSEIVRQLAKSKGYYGQVWGIVVV